ncbi:hypothetical protein AKJ09_08852 [Labilithrix luteola]|uniref:Lipoprotein n=1 Tax=Labilithrix luteola TaxID=1391654 RepID=A0A0K1Q8X3_9BACT|nr:hypothetical protein [Labilithrix luteola]AKV02189.1 hypothetical protein AKJ09_08852 [Labilithrix luteola]
MRNIAIAASIASLGLALVACPSPRMPEGPPPEYEEPPAPSWLDGGSRDSGGDAGEVARPDGGVPST